MTLVDLKPSQIGIIQTLNGDSHLKSRLMEMGFRKGLKIRMIQHLPFNGPLKIRIRNGMISLRQCDAHNIIVTLNEQ
ncbi:MAG: ferrous iron transport protein A [Candidatus Marinimicrobia bacterium]|jgi:Fe2+ transport system protein FeoA|nr:ferrous iron transport protein A [Candidatus Neomarinimicrobiota bacterium]MBT3501912.1 ferrous iron transport protein A [Candidatus Neomarinimicrobiota bacterium]MBT3838562.1 ferrous iron transport protein A [Candidatus Neomarinimicrobiota bacterium]MBT3999824.1 ferrous iron transport protein A [Candidatus Neomarinimicrobiota bacterium]MBT4281879.1 ferrous iron transport protein A [Candidatus Neomarinimicrobiota bacterium]